ncbi:MAG TPA: menaquinone biosynthesis protein [Thermoanaerobaculaceae bacterium]|nr:menaquinone biosynthesis protein [Thermoanaerobaculaceae bacterium]
MSELIRIVGVRFLNARPLLAGVEAGIDAPFPYRFEAAEPSVCADRVAAREAEVGLVPAAALPLVEGLRAVPSLGVAARGKVRSVLLISRVPLERVQTLAAHTASRTSVTLARLLLAERWGASPNVVPSRPPLDTMLETADAAVIIGDPALAVHGRSGLLEVDLAGAWAEWSGLPFVFAVWGVGPMRRRGLESLLERSLEYAEEHWLELVPTWARAHGVSVDQTREYLGKTLTFRLQEPERAGMLEFLRRAAAAGLLPRCGEVWHAA